MTKLVAKFCVCAALLTTAGAHAQQSKVLPWPVFLSPEARAGLEADAARPSLPATDFAARRARSEAIQQEVGRKRLARYGVAMAETVIAGVPVRVFTPRKVRLGSPILLNLHGGAFLIDSGSITDSAPIAGLTGYVVVAPRYRLAPEHLFPAAVDDTLAVYRALLKDHPAGRIGLYGTSAGAILSGQLIARLQVEGLPKPAALGFLSGNADFTRKGDTDAMFGDPATDAGTAYFAGSGGVGNPMFSPLRGSVADWPPTLCLASSRDFLLSATADFCRALDGSGVSSHLVVFDGLPHTFWSYIDAPETDEAFAIVARFLTARLEPRRKSR